jgi:hypothetical protein
VQQQRPSCTQQLIEQTSGDWKAKAADAETEQKNRARAALTARNFGIQVLQGAIIGLWRVSYQLFFPKATAYMSP